MDAGSIGAFIPIVAIIFGIGIAMVSVITSHKEKVRRHELRHAERIAAMEKGMEPPPELADSSDKEKPRPLLTGMILIGVGIGVFLGLKEVAGDGVENFALIPGLIGVAYLLYYFIEGRKEGANGKS